MHLKSTLCAILLVCTVLARAQEDNDNISEPMSADPVAFLRVGRGRYISITSTQYEAIERDGETPPLVAEDVPETPTGISATALSSDEQNAILKAHNDFRALHGSPALTWNDNAAAFGNNWIQACNFAHSHGRYGENLAAGYANFPAAIKAWYDEVKYYDYNNPGFSGKTGHFTQVVWAATTTVGCAVKSCPKYPIYICEYDPPGNVIYNGGNSLFVKNVLP